MEGSEKFKAKLPYLVLIWTLKERVLEEGLDVKTNEGNFLPAR